MGGCEELTLLFFFFFFVRCLWLQLKQIKKFCEKLERHHDLRQEKTTMILKEEKAQMTPRSIGETTIFINYTIHACMKNI